ncbi:MAG: EutP/PduV family microcompartment system protein [Aminipila sp.]
MKNKRVILIGRSTAGKTTLCQYINKEEIRYYKTQTVQLINDQMIDTPGEYLERRFLRGALTVSAADADIIMLVQDATEDGSMFPPGYASMYCKPAVGVVTKSDIASEKQIEQAKKSLILAGAEEIFVTSSMLGTGFENLTKYFVKNI